MYLSDFQILIHSFCNVGRTIQTLSPYRHCLASRARLSRRCCRLSSARLKRHLLYTTCVSQQRAEDHSMVKAIPKNKTSTTWFQFRIFFHLLPLLLKTCLLSLLFLKHHFAISSTSLECFGMVHIHNSRCQT